MPGGGSLEKFSRPAVRIILFSREVTPGGAAFLLEKIDIMDGLRYNRKMLKTEIIYVREV